jgi:hypothetical protein
MESPNSPRLKKLRQAKNKVKSMLIIFFDINGIVHKEFVLRGQTVKGHHFNTIEVNEAGSQAVLNTRTEHDFQDGF